MIISGDDLVNVVKRHVKNYDEQNIGPVSLDVRLAPTILVGVPGVSSITRGPDGKIMYHGFEEVEAEIGSVFAMRAGYFYLASTIEYFEMPSHLAAKLFLRSSSGRAALDHLHAGLLEPGWYGTITMELAPVIDTEFVIGSRIAQVTFEMVSQPVRYTGSYNGQVGPTIAAGGMMATKVEGRVEGGLHDA